MRRLLSLLAVAVVAAAGGCGGGPAAVTGVERFTQAGGSMEPTIKSGQVITTRRVGGHYQPKRGDIVVFHGGDTWGPDTTLPFLKRVIAVGGESIACCDMGGKVIINGTGVDEPYVTHNSPLDTPPRPDVCLSRRFDEVKVPEGSVFVMGDNRAASIDSRCAGLLPVTAVFAIMIG
jgi:signal peptidase I